MKSRTVRWLVALGVCFALASPVHMAAQAHDPKRYPYVLIDTGMLGGAQSFLDLPGVPITADGVDIGAADTTTPDADYPNFNPLLGQDSTIQHAFAWRNGRTTDLGALPGNNSSAIFEINGRGVGMGASENGTIDSITTWPAVHAVIWEDGRVVDLGTLPGGNESGGVAINDAGQVAGFGTNGIADPYSMLFRQPPPLASLQTRGFIWQDGVMRDLGSLGGSDTAAWFMNEAGQIAGQSYTNALVSPYTGVPTQDPFLWQNGHMQDLGTLGGDYGSPNAMNVWGDVVGTSDIAKDTSFHAFLWSGGSLRDLGTFGGSYSQANAISDFRQVVGWATTPNDATNVAALWSHGTMRNLGIPAGDDYSFADDINLLGQVVGGANRFQSPTNPNPQQSAVLWQHGIGVDLNTLVAPSTLHITEAEYINNLGEIAARAVLPPNANGVTYQRAVLLIPAEEAAREGIVSNAPAPSIGTAAVVRPSSAVVCPTLAAWVANRSRQTQHAFPACLHA